MGLTASIRRFARAGLVSLFTLAACAGDGDTQVMPPVVLGMTETIAPLYDDGEVQIYQVTLPVTLPTRRATEEERARGQADPYPRPPFQLASHTRITARYTLTNLEDKKRTVELLVDPWNEFVRYQPGVLVDDEETIPNLSGIDRFVVLEPKQRVEGIITPDDMVELATDLGTAMVIARRPPAADGPFGGAALYNRAFNSQNRSSEPDLVLASYKPAVIAGIVGFDLGLRTLEPAKIAVEVVIDVEDVEGDRLVKEGDTEVRPIGRPGEVLMPPQTPLMN